MKTFISSLSLAIFALLVSPVFANAQQQEAAPLRAPSTPLVAHDPYFSIWSAADRLTDSATRHWTGAPQALNGILRVDGKNYRYLGDADRAIPALVETYRKVTPTRTVVTMQSPEIVLTVTFLTPAFPDDLKVMARPVTYLTWDVKARDGKQHAVSLYLDAEGTLATNNADEPVTWSRAEIEGLHLLRVGTTRQPVLEQYGDNLRINWGYFTMGFPASDGESVLSAGNENYQGIFAASGTIPQQDDLAQPRVPMSHYPAAPTLNAVLKLGTVGAETVSRHALLAYDDVFSVEYMHRKLLPYWRTQFASFTALLQAAEHDYPAMKQRAERYDGELESDLVKVGGPEYAAICILAFRQAIAAHKLVEDANGVPFLMPKENFSNGSISTVDVIYPSSPIFLFLNPKLVEAQMEPVMRYAESGHWKFPFAPHDLGVYPLANGQQYGGGELTEDDQMPVEESGDMILMVAAVARAEHNADFARRYWPLLTKWADYLLAKGFDPENQLSTDDFAGHLAHNTNLSIKAIEALAAYAQLAETVGDRKAAAQYGAVAKEMASKWGPLAAEGDHYRLAFDKANTWSQKYNLVWDNILGLHLFPPEIAQRETAFYMKHVNAFGLPLDNRATYTKLDWTIWSATLASKPEDFRAIVHPVFSFLNQTTDRVPMTDWYDTISAREVAFQARSVVGGVYIRMLADQQEWEKWAGMSAGK
jgi:hypothetical protein